MLCAYTRPRYQVSVDMTIGPLVLWKGLKAYGHVFVTICIPTVIQRLLFANIDSI